MSHKNKHHVSGGGFQTIHPLDQPTGVKPHAGLEVVWPEVKKQPQGRVKNARRRNAHPDRPPPLATRFTETLFSQLYTVNGTLVPYWKSKPVTLKVPPKPMNSKDTTKSPWPSSAREQPLLWLEIPKLVSRATLCHKSCAVVARPNPCCAMRTISRPIGSDAVAAGDTTFHTCSMLREHTN